MITVTVEKINGKALAAGANTKYKIDRQMFARAPQPLTADTVSSKCKLWIKSDIGGSVVEEWLVTETFAAVTDAITTDSAESGSEVTTNKATDFSTLNDTLYPSVDAVEDNFAGRHAYTATTASANTYTVTLVPATTPYVGMRISVVFANANTGSATFNAAAMKKGTAGTTDLASADLVATTKVYTLVYSPQSTWQVQGL